MANVIAVVKLALGEVSYYDPKTGVRLTVRAPYAQITDTMDITNIRKSVRVGRLTLVHGILPAENANYSNVVRRFVKSASEDIKADDFVEEVKEAKLSDEEIEKALQEADANLAAVQQEVEEPIKEEAVKESSEEVVEAEAEKVETETAEETVIEEKVTDEEAKEEAPKKAAKKTATKKTTRTRKTKKA